MPVSGEGGEWSGWPSMLGHLLLAGKEARPCVSWGREFLWIEILTSCLQGDTFVFCLAWQRVKQNGSSQGERGVTVLPRKALQGHLLQWSTLWNPLAHLRFWSIQVETGWGGCPGRFWGDSDAEVALGALRLGHDSQTLACQLPGGLNSCWSLPRVSDSLGFGRPDNLHFFKKDYLFLFILSAQGLSCNMWDLVPWPGVEPRPLHWEHGVLATGPPGKSLRICIFNTVPAVIESLIWAKSSFFSFVSKQISLKIF